jgi:hypothetical protein
MAHLARLARGHQRQLMDRQRQTEPGGTTIASDFL